MLGLKIIINLKSSNMKTPIYLFSLLSIIFFASSFTSVENGCLAWEKLGSKKVSYKLDKDVIHVGLRDGTFTKLKLAVTGGNLNLHRMIVEYGNGTKEQIDVRHQFSKFSTSRIIDLNGGQRIIKDITFFYDTKNHSKNRATLHVFGRK